MFRIKVVQESGFYYFLGGWTSAGYPILVESAKCAVILRTGDLAHYAKDSVQIALDRTNESFKNVEIDYMKE
jgi:hypothetical protein